MVSQSGLFGIPDICAYNASKNGVLGLKKSVYGDDAIYFRRLIEAEEIATTFLVVNIYNLSSVRYEL